MPPFQQPNSLQELMQDTQYNNKHAGIKGYEKTRMPKLLNNYFASSDPHQWWEGDHGKLSGHGIELTGIGGRRGITGHQSEHGDCAVGYRWEEGGDGTLEGTWGLSCRV